MRCVGIDISKAEYCAAGLAVDGVPIRCIAWKHDIKRDSEPAKLVAFEKWVYKVMFLFKPDVVAVEELAVFLNKKVIRTLARREGIALCVAKKKAPIVLHPSIGQSRNVALGIPANSKKEVAFEALRVMYPDFDFGKKSEAAMDKGDGMTHALAAPTILERR